MPGRLPLSSNVRHLIKMKKILPASLCLLLLPQVAWAQDILGIVILFALVPLVNAILAILFAAVSRSGKKLFVHIGLVLLWVLLFWFFGSYTGSDFLAWLPIYLSIAHSISLVFRSIHGIFRKKEV